MNKHTPGPWKAIDVTSEKSLVYRRIDGNGKKMIGFAGVYKMKDKSESEANARLIIAAPELLEALHDIVGDLAEEYFIRAGTYTDGEPLQAALRSALDRAHAAIAKAEGESVPA
jgi:hypothetical protein